MQYIIVYFRAYIHVTWNAFEIEIKQNSTEQNLI